MHRILGKALALQSRVDEVNRAECVLFCNQPAIHGLVENTDEHLADEARMVMEVGGSAPGHMTAQTHAAAQKVGNIAYRCVRVEDLAAEAPHSFDVVTCMEMMEHVPDPAAIVKACAKLVKPDGTVFFSTINRNPKSYLHLIVGAEYVLNFVPKGTHDWHKFITPAELARMCRQAGLDVADTKGLKYNLLTRQFSLDSRTDVNYMIACRPT